MPPASCQVLADTETPWASTLEGKGSDVGEKGPGFSGERPVFPSQVKDPVWGVERRVGEEPWE